jgi:hypothetical protein
MTNNLLGMVRTQFQTRGYKVDDIQRDRSGHPRFTVESDSGGKPVAVTVTFIPTPTNPNGQHWVPEDVRWGTDKTNYTGSTERSSADLADAILQTVAKDNSR